MTTAVENPVTVTQTVKRRVARTQLTDTRSVAAVDVTTSNVSIALIDSSGVPTAFRFAIPTEAHAVHSVGSTLHRHATAVRAVVADLITHGGKQRPAVVAMVKGSWGPMSSDPSAFRRAGLWFAIAAELERLRIPTAEVPMYTVQKWAMGSSQPGRKGTDALANWVAVQWESLPATYKEGFRPSTVAVAAAAAMAVGIETAVPVTQERLNLLRGYADENKTTRNNKAIQWSPRAKPPKTVAEFEMKVRAGA